ncbi:MAG TPA: hypothetical protein VF844_01360 [Ktedonobacteraceae bacterium]
MAMRCPNCSNELSLDESFCGLCGTAIIPSAQPTAMVNPPPSRQGLLSGGYNSTISSPPDANRSGMLPPPDNQSAVRSPGPQQQGGFYQEPTEAMSALPPTQVQNYPTAYPQQGYTGAPVPGGYSGAGQYATQLQPFQSGNYTGTVYPPGPQFPAGQGYGMPPGFTPPPPKQRSNLALIIISICLVLAIITIGALGAVYLLRNNASSKTQALNQNATPTSIPTPTTIPSPSPTPSPTPSPSPTLTPTPAPDPGFTLCDTTCTSNGFSVEYPSAWSQKTTSDSTGTQFTNPSQLDEFAAFKTPGVTSSSSNAGQLVNTDLTNNFASQPGYIAPTPGPSSNATIGGENWSYQTAFYQSNGQTERIEVYATIHQGKAYIIELQALDAQFDFANTQYFERMLARFQFQ